MKNNNLEGPVYKNRFVNSKVIGFIDIDEINYSLVSYL